MNLSRRHLIFGSLALPALAAKKPGETPHIVLILAENLPAWMLGCYGNKEIQTLHIDRLAQTGTRFQTQVAGHALPDPARASLLTGSAAGKTPNLDQLLSAAGYATRSVASGAEAVQFIDDPATAAKPFFLTVTLNALTPPYSAGAKFLDRFANARFQTWEQVPAAATIAADKNMFGAELLPNLRKAAAAVAALDDEVGSITGKLREKKLLDNTLIIFTAPTGSLFGRHGLWGGSTASDPANLFEEVIAPPMIWTWPARVTPLGVASGDGQRFRPRPHALRFDPGHTTFAGSARTQLSAPGARQASAQEAAVALHRVSNVRQCRSRARRSLQAGSAQRRQGSE